jgi:hypothetical protein
MIRESTGRGSTLGIASHPLTTRRATTHVEAYALGMVSASDRAEQQRAEAECRELLDMLCVRGTTTFDRQYTRGEVIFEEGEHGDGLYFLTDGVVKLSKAYSAKEATLMLVGPWEIFGNVAFGRSTAYQNARGGPDELLGKKSPQSVRGEGTEGTPRGGTEDRISAHEVPTKAMWGDRGIPAAP